MKIGFRDANDQLIQRHTTGSFAFPQPGNPTHLRTMSVQSTVPPDATTISIEMSVLRHVPNAKWIVFSDLKINGLLEGQSKQE